MRLLSIAFIALAACAIAQGPPAGGPPPEMRKAFEAMQKWREAHPNVVALDRTVRGLSELQNDPKLKLSKPQAKSVLAVIAKWQPKTAVTDAQAKQINQELTKGLSAAQKKKMQESTQRRGFGGPGGGPGGRPPMGGGPARPGGPGGAGPQAMTPRGGGGARPPMGGGPGGPGGRAMPTPRDYNPLNPKTLPFEPMRPRAQQRMDRLVKSLKEAK